MARPFSSSDARRLVQRHQNIIEKLHNAESSVEKHRSRVKEAADAYIPACIYCAAAPFGSQRQGFA